MNLEDEFGAYKAATLPLVTTPGAEQISRVVHRRLRRRLAATGAFATVLVGALGVQLVAAPKGTVGLAPTESPSPSPSVSPSASPSPSLSPSPSPSPSSPPPTGTPSYSSKVDLVATGPAQAVLTPSEGRYAGVMTATFRNNGAGTYAFGAVRVTLPAGATFDFQGIPTGEWGMDGCSIQSDPQMWECAARPGVIPSRGGQVTVKFRIVAAIAPQPQAMTLEGGKIQPVAFLGSDRKEAPDAKPADNVHKFTLVLNPS
jgi:hypothetical protein